MNIGPAVWFGVVLFAVLTSMLFGAETPQAQAGTVGISDTIVNGLVEPDTRGGMVLDDKYVWISEHKSGLWRAERCTGANAASVGSNDSASWDLWWYNSGAKNGYPSNPDAGYYIYEAGANGMVYIFDTATPASAVASKPTNGGVAYGIYATDPTVHKLYVATTGGLKVYDITTPTNPTPSATLLPSLDFSTVRGDPGQPGYVYAQSFTNNTTYVISTATNTVVGTIAYGGSGTLRRAWVYEAVDNPGHFYLYTVNSSGDLWIVDVTNPTAPTIVSYWNSPAGGVANMPGGSVYVQKDYAFVLTSTGNDRGYVFMLDVRDPANPVLVDTLYDAAFGFNDLRVAGCEIQIAAHDGWKLYRMEGWQPDSWISNTDTSNYVTNGTYEPTTPTTGIKSQYVEAGQTATYQMYFENDADRRDKIALQATTAPAGWTVHYSVGGADVTPAILAGTYLTGYLNPGEGFRVTLTATPAAGAVSPFVADVTAKSWMCMDSMCGGPKDVIRAQATLASPLLEIGKTDNAKYISGGDALTYTITYSNVGYGTAKDATVADVLPVGITYESAIPAPSSVTANTPAAGQTTLTWAVGTLAPRSGPYKIILRAKVALDAADGSNPVNTAKVDYQDVAGNLFAQVTAADTDDTVVPRVLRKKVDKTQANFGDTLTYTLSPRRPGNDLLSNVRVIDPLPSGTTYVSGSVNATGTYGPYASLPAEPGVDLEGGPAGTATLNTTITPSSNFVQRPGTITVTLNVKSSVAVSGVTPTELTVTGPAGHTVTGPSPASADVPAGGSGVNFVWTVTLNDPGEYVFSAGAEDSTPTYTWPAASSASVLASVGGPAVVTWSLGSSVGGVAGVTLTSGRLPGAFAFRGGNTKEFSRYGITTNTWTSKATPTNGIEKGGSLTYDGNDTIYASEGNSKIFYKYDAVANTWSPATGATSLAQPGANFGEGGAIQYLEVGGVKYVYGLLGGGGKAFSRYSIASNTWTPRTDAPGNVKKGGALTTDGVNLYALQGNRQTGFWRFNVATNTWTTLAVTPAAVGWGGSLTRVGGYIYALQGNGKTGFWRYDIAANTWTAMAVTPGAVGDGGALTTDGTYLYALQGKTTDFLRYDIAANTWSATYAPNANFLGGVGQGGALVYDPGLHAEGYFTSMEATPTLVTNNDIMTVKMLVESTTDVTNVVPAVPTVTATGGASATLVDGPAPSSVNLAADVHDYFTWTYKVTAGTSPGSLTFTSSAMGNGSVAFPSTTSNSVLVSPVLTFQTTVNAGATSPISNAYAGFYEANNDRAGILSNQVETKVGSSIGDYIWYDVDGDGVQDLTEAGIANVTVRLFQDTNGNGLYDTDETLKATTTTDSYGSYLFAGLTSGNYVVVVDPATLPAGMAQTYDPDATKNNSHGLTVAAGTDYRAVDFGYDDNGRIGDLVWNDIDGDGTQDAGEAGIAGISVTLYLDANKNGVIDGGDVALAIKSTAADGSYTFTGLPKGTYLVAADATDPQMPADFEATTTTAKAVDLAAGQDYTGGDFGFAAFGSIGDLVWNDANGNGEKDDNEPGISGVQVILNGPTGTFYTTTASDGSYSFAHLPPGTYSIGVNANSLPAGSVQTHDPDGIKNNATTLTLAAGQDYTLGDFGYDGSGKIGDRIWNDANGNGTQDDGEAGLTGVTVSLYEDLNGNGQADPGEPLVGIPTTTGANGAYQFTGLPAGDYVVMATPPAGYTNTTPNPAAVELAPGQTYTAADIGFGQFAQIGDFIWKDLDGNGQQDLGEPGIAGVTVTLTPPTGVDLGKGAGVPVTTTTDSNGRYSFGKLPAGTYTVTVTAPGGYTNTSDPDSNHDSTYTLPVVAGKTYDTIDFGYQGAASIGDQVWRDDNGNGVLDGAEIGIPDMTVYLYEDANSNGYFDDGEPFIGTTITDAAGNYLFGDLPAGDYLVTIDRSSYAGVHGPTTPTTQPVTLLANTPYVDADFGFKTGISAIGDTVFYDDNANGLQDTGTTDEYGIPNITVTLYYDANSDGKFDAGDTLVATDETDADGHYFFGNIPADGSKDYLVMVNTADTDWPAGTALTTPNPYVSTNLAVNTYSSRADFGLRGTSSIGDFVWHDIDGSGAKNGAELGIPNITVQLWLDINGNGVLDTGPGGDLLVSATSTDANGGYLFSNVNTNTDYTYFVHADAADPEMPAGYTATTTNPVAVSIAAAGTKATADVGFASFGSIGDRVWHDANGNGIQDAGEAGLAGVTVKLYNSSAVEIGSATTDATGRYVFSGLAAGEYTVQVTVGVPADYVASPANIPSDDAKDSDSVGGGAVSVTISGGANTTIDFGFYKPVPTLAVVSSFGALVEGGKVVVTWETSSEAKTAGYYLQRLDAKTGDWVTVNEELIPAMFESATGGSYAAIDPDAKPNKDVTYRLQEMETEGGSNYYGDFTVSPKPGATKGDISKQLKKAKIARVAKEGAASAAPAASGARAKRPSGESFTPLCIEVTTSGLYRLDAADIATAAGISPAAVGELIRGNKLALTTQGKAVGILAATDGSALFFYGQAVDSIYTSTNIYWLAGGTGTKITALKDKPAGGTAATTFIDTVRAEKNLLALATFFHDPESDFWAWGYVTAGSATNGTKTFTLDAPGAVRGIQLDVVLQGMTSTGVTNEHHAQIKLNGVSLGDVRWTGKGPHSVSLTVPADALLAGANEVQMTGLRDAGVPYSMLALNSMTLTYERTAAAVADQLLLRRAAAGPVTVSGLSTATAWVFDLADPLLPQLVKTAASGGDGATSWITFSTGASGQDYLVATAAGALKPQAMTATATGALRAAGAGAEYVVITTPALSGAAQRLADYRGGQGLTTKVVTTYEIYDDFSYGLTTPHAFSDFIAYALANWNSAPRFVVFAGEGSWDYKNAMGKNDSLVPPLLVDTDFGLAPSDVRTADVIGDDGVADVAVGRIPALTEAQLDAYVAKVQAYESADGVWRQTALLVADNADNAGAFSVDSDGLAALLPTSMTVQKAYLGPLTTTAARSAILGTLNQGAVLMNYVGHGGLAQLAQENLLTAADVANLATSPRLPVVSTLTCGAGQYALPGTDGLGEVLVKNAAGGAIAVLAPTSSESNSESVLLGSWFLQGMFGLSHEVVLGEVVRTAWGNCAGNGAPMMLLQTYNLLGDPALRVRW